MKKENGFTGVDIVISIFVITIFISVIGNLIVLINLNYKNIERNSDAMVYAIQEIEKIKALGYQEKYDGKGIEIKENIVEEETDIYENEKFTGYHKSVNIEDYVHINQDTDKKPDILKKITVEISYLLGKENKVIKISTYIVKNSEHNLS